ncbi:MAG: endonuclease MutS2 [Eubacteriales bacterium]|nr:endonuclease MutS2 [Eubacteriales bacterium]
MNNKAYKVLEFDKILGKLASYTDSDVVRERIAQLSPHAVLEDAKRAQRETTEAVSTLLKIGSPAVSLSVSDVNGSVRRAESGGTLSPAELIAVSRTLYVARRMKSYLGESTDECEILHSLGDSIVTERAVEDRITSAILSENEIADDASSELSAFRRSKRNLNAKIKDSLNDMVRSNHYKKFLQEPIVTMRSDRYVIPVRSEYRQEVQGIVHDSSASGATLFIEPIGVVNANNEIREIEHKEQREIERILAELSALVAEKGEVITSDNATIRELDFIFCKGKLSLDYGGTEPVLNTEGIIELKRARHPLIAKEVVVANDIRLGEGYDTLVVTGPNTGGKTVTLKTIGLFSLMAASGLHIPASDNSRVALFEKIFADIGDEQSIEQSLSTFSSHMVNIVNILKQVDSSSLALFDELGAGTDPTEGAALAISIIEYLRSFGVRTVATTHYSELKLFALSTDGVENASCEFDVESLKPTYKLLIGVPGKSNAFAISKRLGLDESVINRANEILSDEDIKLEDVITELEQNRAKAESEMQYATRMRRELSDLKDEIERERKKLKESKARIMEEAHREAKLIVSDAKDEANKIIRELEKMRIEGAKNVDERTGELKSKLKKKEDSIDKAISRASKPKKTFREPPKNLKEGETVKIISVGETATVLKTPSKDDKTVRVQAGIIKMDVHITDLERVSDNTTKELVQKYVKSTGAYMSKTKDATTEIDVRGQELYEAIMNVEKFLDDCYLAGVSPVSIIHGKGTGVLRKGIGDMLKKHRYVKEHRLGRYGEGETGVTIVELK